MNKTTKMNKNMIPAIIFGEYGWNFLFVNPKTKEYFKSESATKAWLKGQNISVDSFTVKCWEIYDMFKVDGIEYGLVCFFAKDDKVISKLNHSIDVEKFY